MREVIRLIKETQISAERAAGFCEGMEIADPENRVLYMIVATDINSAIHCLELAQEKLEAKLPPVMDLEDLDLSVRTYRILKREGIETVLQLAQMSHDEVKRIRGMGGRSYVEIITALERNNIELRR